MTGRAVRVLLFVLVTGGLTAGILLQVAPVGGGPETRLTATFEDVGGLEAGDEVQLAGVPVGTVESVTVDHGAARVAFTVREGVTVPADSAVAVRWQDLIGQRELQVLPGEAGRAATDGTELTETRSVVDIARLIDELGPFARTLRPGQLNRLMEALVEALRDNRGNVRRLVADLDTVLATLAQRDDTIRRMLDDYGTIADVLARRDRQIRTMVDNLTVLTETLASSEQLLDDALVQLSGVSTDLRGFLDANADELSAITGDLARVTEAATGRLDELETVVARLPAALRSLFAATRTGSYVSLDVVCVTPAFPPCPTPGEPPPGGAGGGAPASGAPDGLDELRRLLLGEGR